MPRRTKLFTDRVLARPRGGTWGRKAPSGSPTSEISTANVGRRRLRFVTSYTMRKSCPTVTARA